MAESARGVCAPDNYPDWLILDKKLNELQDIDLDCVWVIEIHFLTGMNINETAEAMEVSAKTTYRKWRFTRAWLQQQLAEQLN